nr:MAG TPA: hypothetical protein [Caudoviricetes sp.]
MQNLFDFANFLPEYFYKPPSFLLSFENHPRRDCQTVSLSVMKGAGMVNFNIFVNVKP